MRLIYQHRKRYTPYVVVLFVLGFFSSYAIAESVVEIEKKYYLVSGQTEKEIRNDLDEKTPIHEGGKSYDAYTKWDVTWRFWWNESTVSCEITKLTTKVDIKYTLPKHAAAESLGTRLKKRWKTYQKALIKHEEGHKDFGINAAKGIENRIMTMGARASCDQLEEDANKIGYSVLEEYKLREKNYDRETNYGMNDGAIFP
ncbi:MAG: DUF922 domain-containing Zn-dependent protease [Gammaproteobacteria bacterium]|nr:DUF922 domain-containing Zn-dependent protease [Gammaproteobacteria bacterium]